MALTGFNMVFTTGGLSEFFTQLTDDNIYEFKPRLVPATLEMVEEHFLFQVCAFAKAQKFKHLIFFTCQIDRVAIE
jgi:hypothetical protein